ncbi:MAG: cbb3-type cytochrome c oxidase N-terminal domain-containing protein [Fuerstiella sp.]
MRDDANQSENEVSLGHSYDGIQEYDNPMPGWWKFVFLISALYAIPYMAYYHNGSADRTIHSDYSNAVAANMRLQFDEIGELAAEQATVMKYIDDDKWLAVGKSVFTTHCASCHGAAGQGKVGFNLTDDYWKHVKHAGDIAKVVIEGANNKSMPAWKSRLHPNEIVLVSSYVASLRGSNPSGAAEPKPGEKIIPSWKESFAEVQAANKPDSNDESSDTNSATEPESTEPEA